MDTASDSSPDPRTITGVVLAGGRARRMDGKDKGLIPLGQRCMIEYVLDVLAPQVNEVIINANRNTDTYARYGYAVVSDEHSGFAGPLAGMASAMAAARNPLILSVPCDCPRIPEDLARRLATALEREQADVAVAHDGTRMQPVFALLHRSLLGSMRAYLDRGERKIDRWYQQHAVARADFSDVPDAFANINTPEDRDQLFQRLNAHP